MQWSKYALQAELDQWSVAFLRKELTESRLEMWGGGWGWGQLTETGL